MSTIRDVAKLAQVSTATVSRVLNNDSTYKMKNETREKVWEAVTKLNYKTSSAAKIKSKKVDHISIKSEIKIGCVLSVTEKKYNDPYFMSILNGIETRLVEKGYEISFVKTGHELEDKQKLFTTFSEPVTGLILMVPLSNESYEFIKNQVPYIVGIDTKRNDIDNVGYDHYHVACMAVQHLIEQGHRNIGYIGGGGPTKNLKDSERYKGYYSTLLTAGLTVKPEWVIDCCWDEDICIEKMNYLIQTNNYPSAFFAGSDLMAMAALSCLYDNCISVPDDIAIIGLSNIEVSKYSNPPLTTFDVPTKEIGMVAVDLLLARMNGDNLLPKKVILPTSLIKRSST